MSTSIPLYAIRRVSKVDSMYGPVHICNNDLDTLCGKHADGNRWYILGDANGQQITFCGKCAKKYIKLGGSK